MTAPAKQSTAIARIEQAAESGKGLTVGERKKFLEVASRTDLDRIPAEEQRSALIAFGQHTGLRPELGEVMIYQGRFYVTMLGRVRNAHRLGLFDGLQVRPASASERTNSGYEDGDIVWTSEAFRKGCARPFRGWGKVTAAELATMRAGDRTKFTPVAKHPVEMARKRSEYDALRLAFPLDEELTEISRRFIETAEAEVIGPQDAALAGSTADAAGDAEAAAEIEDERGAPEPAKGPALELGA